MQKINIINPTAGKNQAIKVIGTEKDALSYVTVSQGDAERYVYETALLAPDTHFCVYGGDGTIAETANGIIRAGAGLTAKLSAKPYGTGNDLLRNFTEPGEYVIDALKYSVDGGETKYILNMINIGFDCNVSDCAKHYKRKRFIPTSLAYPLSIAENFFRKFGQELDVTYTTLDGEERSLSGKLLFTAVSNGMCCGGGYRSSPFSLLDDGHMEIIICKMMKRLKFLDLIAKYKTGAHINMETGDVTDVFKDYMVYTHVSKVKISGMNLVALDGESTEAHTVELEILPKAITFVQE